MLRGMHTVAATLPQVPRLPLRTRPVRGIVLHSTGRPLAVRCAEYAGSTQPADVDAAAVAWYRSSGFSYFGGYLVGTSGTVYRLAPDEVRTQHAAELDSRYKSSAWRSWAHVDGRWQQHGRDPAQVWDWWDARWPGLSPPDLLGMRPNDALGVDLLPTPAGRYTDDQVAQARRLVHHLCAAHGLRPARGVVVGHEDVDPCSRGTVRRGGKIVGIPWDPGPLDWSALALEA